MSVQCDECETKHLCSICEYKQEEHKAKEPEPCFLDVKDRFIDQDGNDIDDITGYLNSRPRSVKYLALVKWRAIRQELYRGPNTYVLGGLSPSLLNKDFLEFLTGYCSYCDIYNGMCTRCELLVSYTEGNIISCLSKKHPSYDSYLNRNSKFRLVRLYSVDQVINLIKSVEVPKSWEV
jgi:hypothetical protein